MMAQYRAVSFNISFTFPIPIVKKKMIDDEEEKKKQSALKLQAAVTGEKPPPPVHDLAGLSCSDHGGPSNDLAKEMIYWSDIPSDDKFVSPIGAKSNKRKYLTFEPDGKSFYQLPSRRHLVFSSSLR